jgi:hypothetical protein
LKTETKKKPTRYPLNLGAGEAVAPQLKTFLKRHPVPEGISKLHAEILTAYAADHTLAAGPQDGFGQLFTEAYAADPDWTLLLMTRMRKWALELRKRGSGRARILLTDTSNARLAQSAGPKEFARHFPALSIQEVKDARRILSGGEKTGWKSPREV